MLPCHLSTLSALRLLRAILRGVRVMIATVTASDYNGFRRIQQRLEILGLCTMSRISSTEGGSTRPFPRRLLRFSLPLSSGGSNDI